VVVRHRTLWDQAWQQHLHIVGDTNLGEIRFDVETAGGVEAIQYLWWWHPPGAAQPSPATEYRASLRPPAPSDAPPLPTPPLPTPPLPTRPAPPATPPGPM
jgi:hypothetical protein